MAKSLAQTTVSTYSNKLLRHIGIVKLYNGEYIIVMNNIKEKDILDTIRDIEENQGYEEPRNIENN